MGGGSKLAGAEVQRLQEALLSAFPSRRDLAQMVRVGLSENLDQVASSENLRSVVFDLIQWAEARGRIDDLLAAARTATPRNPLLRAFVDERVHGPRAAPRLETQTRDIVRQFVGSAKLLLFVSAVIVIVVIMVGPTFPRGTGKIRILLYSDSRLRMSGEDAMSLARRVESDHFRLAYEGVMNIRGDDFAINFADVLDAPQVAGSVRDSLKASGDYTVFAYLTPRRLEGRDLNGFNIYNAFSFCVKRVCAISIRDVPQDGPRTKDMPLGAATPYVVAKLVLRSAELLASERSGRPFSRPPNRTRSCYMDFHDEKATFISLLKTRDPLCRDEAEWLRSYAGEDVLRDINMLMGLNRASAPQATVRM